MDKAIRPKTQVYFRWHCPDVKPTEEVRAVGSAEELGNWQPSMGIPLDQHPTEPACWSSRAVPLPIGREVQYKYVVCSKNSYEDVRWESRQDNRCMVPTGRKLIVEDDGGVYRHLLVTTVARREKPLEAMGLEESTIAPTPGLPRLQSFEEKVKAEEAIQVTKNDRVLAVFRTLPVQISKNGSGEWKVQPAEAIAFKVVSMVQRSLPECTSKEGSASITFVGHPGVFTNDVEERRKIQEALAPHRCVPVFLDKQVFQTNLEFCHSFLWPVMHNMKVFDHDAEASQDEDASTKFEEAHWKNYQQVNRAYADVIEANYVQGSLVWVHDFYLLLVPRPLKLRHPDISIGFFVHSAFPSSEVLRCMPMREEILQSMLSCKVVTFQIFEYARHFLSCCQLLLNATHYFHGAGVLHLEHDGESVVVRADHFVVPFADFVQRMGEKAVQEKAAAVRREFGDRMLFASIDGDEPFSGMILKLRAFSKFLSECPQHVHRVALLQHVLTRRTATGEDSDMMKEVKRMAEEMNKNAQQPQPIVVIREGDLNVDERLSLLQATDVLLDTSINDGLNLHPFLYCCAHSKDAKGALIVSEFTGCSNVLTGAVKVNPWNTQQVMDSMHSVVTMEDEERDRRFKQDHSYVSTQKLSTWVTQNLAEIKQAQVKKSSGPIKGLGAGSRLLFMERGFRHLSSEAVIHDYRRAKTRAIFLDNEGTLAPDKRSLIRGYGAQQELLSKGQPPDPAVIDSLRSLASDRANTVLVISGRGRDFLDRWFGDVDDLGLCAEHGFYWIPPFKKAGSGADRWKCMTDCIEEDEDWKKIASAFLEQYVKRVQGSVMEFKGSAVSWNYRKVGAQMLANEIALELTRFLDPKNGPDSLMYGYPVVVVNGKGYVEVKRADVDKGVAVNRVLQEIKEQYGQIDFVLCIGDDRSDEDMFEVVNDLAKRGRGGSCLEDSDEMPSPKTEHTRRGSGDGWSSSGTGLRLATAGGPAGMQKRGSLTLEEFNAGDQEKGSKYYTVTVGRKPSSAKYFVKDVDEVSELLTKLALQARVTNLGRFSSMPMLARADDDDSD